MATLPRHTFHLKRMYDSRCGSGMIDFSDTFSNIRSNTKAFTMTPQHLNERIVERDEDGEHRIQFVKQQTKAR